ncbi:MULTISPECIES: GumC family protein [Spirosoma]|uniref:Lipopolysaccharide biosynthesis protein n=1 Tax=Spirosoma sordidisoli TaxID=2502893 RepID=A0A4Q2URP9_9BACT|nr:MULTISPECIES: lipopolysaccharide biosynthesis protein [Spirosoma]RYC72146.1 lipopolysaccharide biosynthesis protein [Spirosoma sordidisoli]
MNISVFLRLLKQHLPLFVLIPCITAGTAWYATRNEPKVYKSEATLYTGLASGYSLLSDKQAAYGDRSASAFDNLLTTLYSKETMLQVGIHLLADHLRLQQPDSLVLGAGGFQQLQQAVPPSLRYQLPLEGDPALLITALDSLSKAQMTNPIKDLLLTSNSYYSLRHLTETLKATARKATNDILLMEYESDDPAVAQRTLRYAIDMLNERYSLFKTSETNSVVGYYEGKLAKAKQNLDEAEGRLRAFNIQHKVLDFDSESKNVSASKELLSTEYNQELMRRDAAKAAIDALDRRMGQQGSVRSANTDLSLKQKKLADAENQLANARAYNQPRHIITRLQAAVTQASEELKLSAQKYDAAASAPDALPAQSMANDRMTKILEYEESNARLRTYKKRMDEYQAKLSEYSPLGTQLRQLQRELAVAEKEYLDLLQNVDQSRMRRQDVKIGGTLEVLDAPYFPLLPQAAKRWQLVAIGFGVGLFLALVLTALRFWLDKKIHSPDQAEQMVGMPVTAVFPTVSKPNVYSKVTWASRSMFERLFNAIHIEITQATSSPYPPIITLFSIRPKQGKSWVANGLAQLYNDADQQVAYCYPRQKGNEQREIRNGITFFPYTIRPDFMNVTDISYLLDASQDFDATRYDRILLELPSLIDHQIPVFLLKRSALSLLVIDANTAWTRAEKQLLSLYARVTNQPMLLILNRVGGNYMDVPGRNDAKLAPIQSENSLHTQRNMT